jgi:hypothetical protein
MDRDRKYHQKMIEDMIARNDRLMADAKASQSTTWAKDILPMLPTAVMAFQKLYPYVQAAAAR